MKLTILLLTIACLDVSATAYSQGISVNFKNETFKNVIEKVSQVSGYSVLADAKDMESAKNVSINLKNADLSEVLRECFANQPFTYEIHKKTILIVSKNPAWVLSGKILNEKGEPVMGASIQIKGTGIGTTSKQDGSFSLNVNSSDAVLIVSFIGYKTLEIPVKQNSEPINITLVAEETVMTDVVVTTALGIKRATKALSYNVQEVKGDELTKVKDANFMNALSGKVAGVNINSSSSGIGGAAKVVMRGAKSITKSNNALYVIDGIPMYNRVSEQGSDRFGSNGATEGAADINPEDIESISILTGAAAAALYGSDAANGVVLINTKKGKEGKLSVNFSSQLDLMTPFVLPRFQNKYGKSIADAKSWGALLDESQRTYDPKKFFNTGTNFTNSISLSTGNSQNQTFFSASSTNATGIVPNNNYDRYNFTIRNTAKFLKDKIALDLGANYIRQTDNNMRNQGEYFNPVVPVYLFPRGEDFIPIRAFERYDEARKVSLPYWPYGDGGLTMQNPYWVAHRIINANAKDRYMLNGSLKYNILDWLSATARIKYDNSVIKNEEKRNAGTLLMFTGGSDKGFYAYSTEIQKQLYTDAMLSVDKKFEDFSVSLNTGGVYSDYRSDVNGFRAPLKEEGVSNFFSPYNQRFTGQDANPIVGYNGIRSYSLFFSSEFSWKRLIYATITGRNEWPSQLVNTKQKSYYYPSYGLSAIVSDMVKLPQPISFLKVRTSWASVGTPPPFGLTSPTYNNNVQTGLWIPPDYIIIQDLFPERTDSWEIGLNTKLLSNKLSFDISYYHSNTRRQTFKPDITTSSGASKMVVQSGNIENKGIEAVLGYTDKYLSDLSWDTKLTFSTNKNKIIELADDYVDPTTGEHRAINQLILGGVADAKFILRKNGTMGDIYSSTDIKRDENGQIFVSPSEGKIYPAGNKEIFLGSVFPKFNMGWSNEISYKGLSLGFLISGRFGGIVLSSTQATLDNFGVSKTSADVRDKGGVDINNGKLDAKSWFDVVAAGQGMMAYYTYDATNVRLQEARLNYMLPSKFFKKNRISVGITGRNLLMIYNKAPFDPETTASTGNFYQGLDYFMMPSLRNIGFNIKLQF